MTQYTSLMLTHITSSDTIHHPPAGGATPPRRSDSQASATTLCSPIRPPTPVCLRPCSFYSNSADCWVAAGASDQSDGEGGTWNSTQTASKTYTRNTHTHKTHTPTAIFICTFDSFLGSLSHKCNTSPVSTSSVQALLATEVSCILIHTLIYSIIGVLSF